MKLTPNTPVTVLGGCGKKRAELLSALGINNIKQLLRHFPRAYQNRGDVKSLAEASHGETGSFVLTVTSAAVSVRLRGGKTLTKCKAFDGEKSCTLIFFNRPYIKNTLVNGNTYRFWGKLVIGKNGFELSPSSVEPVTESSHLRGYVPLYPLTSGLTQSVITGLIQSALRDMDKESFGDVLPESVRERLDACGEAEAYSYIHSPRGFDDIEKGRSRFIAEELFLFACSVTAVKEGRRGALGIKMDPEKSKLYDFTAVLPFTLTRAQSKVISEVRKDMTQNEYPMARLVSGDVGSGKTVCAAAAAFIAIRNGYQCALMAPTEILARQHYRELTGLFDKLGIRCGYLSGSLTAAEKRAVYASLECGETDLIIGTHALLSEGVKFARLGLVITDEQHRFGVMQRAVLTGKGKAPHVLVMSATPIPRTLALILCGDLDISVIDELPPGRQKVDTLVVGEEHRNRMYGFIGQQVAEGRQIYIVCPTVEAAPEEEEAESEFVRFDFDKNAEKLPALKSAVEYEENLRKNVFPTLRTAFIHGRMQGKEKDAIMRRFADGEIDILVSTTVIEVGVNVPNATVMVVENAERFGLSQLHQLRGRVGRGAEKSYCILVSDAKGENAVKRLGIMRSVADGYKIAQYDLEMRGPGDFVTVGDRSARQHGNVNFDIAGLCTDTLMLEKAFSAASELIENDPYLEKEENKAIKAALGELNGLHIASIS